MEVTYWYLNCERLLNANNGDYFSLLTSVSFYTLPITSIGFEHSPLDWVFLTRLLRQSLFFWNKLGRGSAKSWAKNKKLIISILIIDNYVYLYLFKNIQPATKRKQHSLKLMRTMGLRFLRKSPNVVYADWSFEIQTWLQIVIIYLLGCMFSML